MNTAQVQRKIERLGFDKYLGIMLFQMELTGDAQDALANPTGPDALEGFSLTEIFTLRDTVGLYVHNTPDGMLLKEYSESGASAPGRPFVVEETTPEDAAKAFMLDFIPSYGIEKAALRDFLDGEALILVELDGTIVTPDTHVTEAAYAYAEKQYRHFSLHESERQKILNPVHTSITESIKFLEGVV